MATKVKVDTPRKGSWHETVNTQPLPPTVAHKLTLEELVKAQRNGTLNVSAIHDIIKLDDEERKYQERRKKV